MELSDIKTKISVMVPVAFVIILLGLANNIEFKDDFSPAELQILNFKYRQLNIQEKQTPVPVNILEGPFDPGRFEQEHEISERSDMAVKTENLEVSLIIVSGSSRMAIIQGILVKEGGMIYDKRVVKIESKRVLLNNGENKWIYVKK